jgi:hypothetical protein
MSTPCPTYRLLTQVHRIAMDKLREAFKDVQPQLESAHRARGNSSESEKEKERERMDGIEMMEK